MSAPPSPHAEVALSLALAMVASSDAPLLLLDGDLQVLAASASFCRAFNLDPAQTHGRSVFDLGAGEWGRPRLRSLLSATVSGAAEIDAYEMDLERPGLPSRRLVLKPQKLEYGDVEQVRLLLTVSDVTDARAADKLRDDLLREKQILLQEVQHRVANSLQIIASVLLQSARKVSSEETRGHLHDAHHRVMSIAAVQKQLAATTLSDVALEPYLSQLCQSISASMIDEPRRLSLDVFADDSAVSADVSVSLGLIVTELVINALKHAFPGHRSGKIVVTYAARGPDWTLSVSDNGVGMPQGEERRTPGLGSSIVDALARKLDAETHVRDAKPGTAVSVEHRGAVALSTAQAV
jgi:two-component sensor histidine kinase